MKAIVSLAMNPSIDMSTNIDKVVVERKLHCQIPVYEPGGGGVNVSRAIKKLGGESILLYPSGGWVGKWLNDLLAKENIEYQAITIRETSRENVSIFEESSGLQYRFGMPGPTLQKEEWEECFEELKKVHQKPDYIVASGSLSSGVPIDFYSQIAQLGRERGIKVIIDAPSENLKLVLKKGVYLIKPNLNEFKQLFVEELTDYFQIQNKAKSIVESGQCEVVVVSLGGDGVIVAAHKQVEYITLPNVPVISKVGAGDSMVAGIVLSLARGMEIFDAVKFGAAAGAAAVMRAGGELCRKEDAERIYKEIS